VNGTLLALGSVGALVAGAEVRARPAGRGSLSRTQTGVGLLLLAGAAGLAWKAGFVPGARAAVVARPPTPPTPAPEVPSEVPAPAPRPVTRCTPDGVSPTSAVRRRGRPSNPNPRSWKGRLGTEIKGGINFHCLLDGRNNYRGAIDWTCKGYTIPSKEFFEELRREYGIERVLTLNAECGGRELPALIQAAGLESLYRPQGSGGPSRKGLEEMKAFLRKGNALVHCVHGADRTGAIVGRYYVEEGLLPLDVAVAHTREFGGHKYENAQKYLLEGPSR
jgi:hypothetical protein